MTFCPEAIRATELPAKATARPWGHRSFGHFTPIDDAALIVYAVNNLERLLEIEAAARVQGHVHTEEQEEFYDCRLCQALALPPSGEAGG